MIADPANHSESSHHTVLKLRVTGGFLDGVELEFIDGLNCFIGGRGAGKTTALEFLRFGLGLMPDPKTSPQRHKAIDGLVKANLGSGRISIEVRTKTGMRYTAGRAANESVQVLNEAGTAVPISLDRDLIFGADVFSQNEIEEIASSPAAQLALLDRFQEEEALSIARDLDQAHRQLEQSGADLRRLDEEIDDLRAKASEIVAIEEKLKGIAEVGGPDADRLNAAHAAKSERAKEEKVPGLVLAATHKALREMNASAASFQANVDAQLENALIQGVNREVFQPFDADVQVLARLLASAVASVEESARALEGR